MIKGITLSPKRSYSNTILLKDVFGNMISSMKVTLENCLNEYDEFIKNNSCTFYQSPKHLNLLENLLGIKTKFIAAIENEKLVGVLPFFQKKTKFGDVINSLPFFGSYGGVISNKKDVKKSIIDFLNDYNKENEVLSSVIISNPFEHTEIYEKYYRFHEKEDRMVQCTKFDNMSDVDLWNNFEQRVRRSVRKAEKNSVFIEYASLSDELLDDFYNTHISNFSSKDGTTKPKEFFTLLKENLIIGKDYDILIAIHDSKPIAYLLIFYFKFFTEYYMPAYNIEKSSLQGTSLLIWESMKKSLTNNIKYYNFGGTHMDQKSLYNFKKGWGANDFHYKYYVYGDLTRINELGRDILKENFKNFYVYNYGKLSN